MTGTKANPGTACLGETYNLTTVQNLPIPQVSRQPRHMKHLALRHTMKFQPDVIAGEVFSDDTKMTVWVSDDQNKIPLLIESPVSVGSVKMVLKEYWGLKYEFKAKR